MGVSSTVSLVLASFLALEKVDWDFRVASKGPLIAAATAFIITMICFFVQRKAKILNKRTKEQLLDFFEHVENSNLGMYPLKILHAEYGANGNNVDVTEDIRMRVGVNGISFQLTHGVFEDHVKNVKKTLSILYMHHGIVNTKWFTDNTLVEILIE